LGKKLRRYGVLILARYRRDIVRGPVLTRLAGTAALLLAALGVLSAPALAATSGQTRIGTEPELPSGTTLLAGVASVPRLQVTLALEPRDSAALKDYAAAVGDPTSPDYRHYLTPSQFRQQFAPAPATVAAVEASLRSHGLKPGAVTANGLSIHVQASGAAIEHAFAVTLARVRLPTRRDALVNTQPPAVDAKIAPAVQAVLGLNGIPQMERLDVRHAVTPRSSARARGAEVSSAHVATGGPRPCVKAQEIAPGQGAYTADQIASAYGFSGVYEAGDLGQGVTVGMYELEPNLVSDIAAYQTCYGTHTDVNYVKVDGGVGTGAGQGEAALDIEQVIGLAPKANILVYQGPNNSSDSPGTGPYDTLQQMISQDKVQVISNSWGECESLEGPTDASAESTLLQEATTQGQTFVSAAGDSGSEDCYSPPPGGNLQNQLAVDDPGSQEYATSVGGTTLTTIGPPPAESVWNDDNPNFDYARLGIEPGAGGGGISTLWGMPSYQTTAPATLAVINSNSSNAPCAAAVGSYCREVPDVSADADPATPYLDYWNGDGSSTRSENGWQGTGGTSGAAPVWASLFALADASSNCRGTLIGFANPTLYSLAGQAQTTYFNDIVNGNNDFTPDGNTSGLYAAAIGYDMATGLGTPKASALVPALCQQAVHVHYPGAVYTFYDQYARLAMKATLAAGETGPLTFKANRLPAGMHINRSTGVITGKVTSAGVRTVTVTASTPSGIYGAVQFVWSVERRPLVALVGLGSGKQPALTVRLSSGEYEPGLSQITVQLPGRLTLPGGAKHVQVLASGGRELPHRGSFQHQLLTIKMDAAHSPLRIVFAAGSLRTRGTLAGVVQVMVQTVDRVGGSTKLERSVRGVKPTVTPIKRPVHATKAR
jgi:subtilase family serine protease